MKFATNSSEVLKAIPKESRLPHLVLDLDENEFGEASSLGLTWQQWMMFFTAKLAKS